MDRLGAITVFVAVAEAGSLSAAARHLRMPLTTVSRRLAALEEQVGVRLMTRTTRHLALTEPGRHYLESCRRILAELEAVELALAGQHSEPRGEIAITAPAMFGVLHVVPVVVAFLDALPGVTDRLLLVDRVVDLIEEGLDVSVRIGALPDSSLMATRIGSLRLVTCASPAYLAQRGTPAAPQELARHDCISFGSFAPAERWIYAGAARPQRVAVHARLVVNTADAAIDAARAGLGITKVLSYQAQASVAEGAFAPHPRRFRAGAYSREPAASRGPAAAGQGAKLHRLRRAAAPRRAEGPFGPLWLRRADAWLPKSQASC
ncbi:MAG: LysR family transcriptional regulator [Methyloceanibacter sp.]